MGFLLYIIGFLCAIFNVSFQDTIVVKNNSPVENQFRFANSTYIIKEIVNLEGKELTIPFNSKIVFKQDGAICNGRVKFDNTIIKYSRKRARFSNCSFEGSIKNKELHISVMGINADGYHDDAPIISQVFDCIQNQGTHLFFNCNGDYLIGSEHSKARPDVHVRSNTIVEFTGKGFMTLGCKSKIGAVLILGGADNVTIINPQIDGGGKAVTENDHGEDGLALGGGGENVRILGGVIRNCAKGDDILKDGKIIVGDGGKGIQVEPYGLSNCLVDGTTIINCNKAISCHRDLRYAQPIQVVFNNIHAKNCNQFAIVRQVYGFSSKTEEQDVVISNCIIENCGDEDGVFIFGETRFLRVNNCKVFGNNKVKAIFRGRVSKSVFNNIIIDQYSESIIDLDPSPYGPPRDEAFHNYFNIDVKSPYDYLLTTNYNINDTNFNMYRSIIDIKANYEPLCSWYNGIAVKSNKFILNTNKETVKDGNKSTNSKGVKGDVVWDDKLGKLLIKEENLWVDVEGNNFK